MTPLIARHAETRPRWASGAASLLRRAARRAWVMILLADAGIVVYGITAFVVPSILAAGYESAVSSSWAVLVARSPETAAYLLWLYRLIGGLNIALGVALAAIAMGPFRRGERWARWTLLLGNALGYGVPMAFDQVTGAIGVFEMLEFVALGAVAVALALSGWANARGPRPAHVHASPGGS